MTSVSVVLAELLKLDAFDRYWSIVALVVAAERRAAGESVNDRDDVLDEVIDILDLVAGSPLPLPVARRGQA